MKRSLLNCPGILKIDSLHKPMDILKELIHDFEELADIILLCNKISKTLIKFNINNIVICNKYAI